jgi:cytochrome c oxidase assembly protein subunit 15
MQQTGSKGRLFRRFSIVTIIAVFLLIAVGGIVRSTGSGMGCPDWPKCFGSWVPPTDVAQLPSNYKDIYAQQRAEKNIKFVGYLRSFGFDDVALEIENDPSILIEEDFNAAKTWTEYVNRLIGALIGILIFATFLSSFSYWREDKTVTVLSFLAFVLVGFQGWLGSIVVSTNLL